MKRLFLIFLSLSLIVCLNGCFEVTLTDASLPEQNWEELDAYKALESGISDEPTLPEMMDAFEAMCQVPMETTCDIFVYDVHAYEYEGTKYLHFMVSRQFEISTYYEFLECGFSATYILEDDIAGLSENIHAEITWQQFVEAVKTSEAYSVLLDKPMYEYNVGIDSW